MIKNCILWLALLLGCMVCPAKAQNSDGVVLRYGEHIDNGYGENSATVITPYVVFPAEMTAAYTGNAITHVNIGLTGDATNVYVYIKHAPEDAAPLYRQKVGDLKKGWNTVTLETPFEITGEDIAVGYKASFSLANGVGVGYSSESWENGDYVFWNSRNAWYKTGGSICIQAVVNGDNMPADELSLRLLSGTQVTYGERTTVEGCVRNMGMNAIDSYEVAWSLDNGESGSKSIDSDLSVNASDTFALDIPGMMPGNHILTVRVNSVNGRDDTYAVNSVDELTYEVRDRTYMGRVVVEEGTGTWCGLCPSGMEGMKQMKQLHPETFISIAVHVTDEFTVDSYEPLTSLFTGVPYCYVNRKYSGHPWNDIRMLYELALYEECHFGYMLEADFTPDSSQLELRGRMISDRRLSGADYRMAFVVVEDSVVAKQTNYFAGGQYGDFYGWEDLPEIVEIKHEDLARGIFSSFDGDVCTPQTMEAGTYYEYGYTLTLPDNIRSKKNVRVIGIVIDPQTGYIVNGYNAVPGVDLPSHVAVPTEQPLDFNVRTDESSIVVDGLRGENLVALYSVSGRALWQSVTREHGLTIPAVGLHGVYFVTVCNEMQSRRTVKVVL